MLCGCGMAAMDTSPILDLHAAIEEYAWKEFRHSNSFLSGVLVRRSDFVIDIPWDFFEFDHHTTKFNPRHNTTDGFIEKNVVTLCSATFTNETKVKQIYKFKSKRSTKAITTVSYQRGFTIKDVANFVLTVPKQFGDFGVRDSFDGQFKISKRFGETFEEVFDWEIDNDITVEKHHVSEAKMVITEDELVADFEVRTVVRMPANNAPIEIKRKGAENSKSVILLHDLSDVFGQQKGQSINIIKVTDSRKVSRYDLELTTVGVIRSTRWRDRRITLSSKSLKHPTIKAGTTCTTRAPKLQESFSFDSDDLLARVLKHTSLAPNVSSLSDTPEPYYSQVMRGDSLRKHTLNVNKQCVYASPLTTSAIEESKASDRETVLETSINDLEFPPPPPDDSIPEQNLELLPEFRQFELNHTYKTNLFAEHDSLRKLLALHKQSTLESDTGTSAASSDVTVKDLSLDHRTVSLDVPPPKGILVSGNKRGKLSKVTSV